MESDSSLMRDSTLSEGKDEVFKAHIKHREHVKLQESLAMSWVNDIIGKTKDEDAELELHAIKESAKVFTSALLNKREQKRRM